MELDINLLRDSLRRGSSDELATALKAHHPADLAAALQDLEPSVAWDILHQAAIPGRPPVSAILTPTSRPLRSTTTPHRTLPPSPCPLEATIAPALTGRLTRHSAAP